MKTKSLYIIALMAVMISVYDTIAQNYNVTLAGKSGGKATAAQLAADSMLTAADDGMTVLSFRMSKYEKDKDAVEIESSSAMLSASMRQHIAQAATGTKIYFEYIKGKNSRGEMIALSPMAFVIK